MKIMIDEEVVLQYMPLQDFLLCLSIANSGEEDITQSINRIRDEGLIFRNGDGKHIVFSNIKRQISEILLKSDTSIPSEDELKPIVIKMRSFFPSGQKEGTNSMWRSNIKDVVEQLRYFMLEYRPDYSLDDIVQATKEYVESYNGIYTYMRTLPNFIVKIINGKPESQLMTALDNLGNNTCENFDNSELIV